MRNFTVLDLEQRTEAWASARLGRVTASRAGDMLAKTSSGWAASRDKLLWQLVLERLTNRPQESGFVSAAMQRGQDLEPQAVAGYEALTGHLVRTCGFLKHDDLMAGASLDGYLGDFQVLVSIKCREAKAHAEHLLTGAIPKSAREQMRHELWLTGATDHHYVSWNPDFPEPLQLRVHVLKAKDLDIPGYNVEILKFLAEVEKAEAKLRQVAA